MKKRLYSVIIIVSMIVSVSGCATTPTNPSGSATPGTATQSPSPPTVEPTGTAAPSPSPSADTAPPTVSPSASELPTPKPSPDPASLTLTTKPAYPNLKFQQPLYYTVSGDGSGDVYVVERTGKIKVFADNPDTAGADVFLDLGALINHNGQEQGLLGLAFHPDYLHNGYFYVNYTDQSGSVIARYSRQTGSPRAADLSSGIVLLTFQQPYPNHNGGQLAFGPDGYLYIGTGDGGSRGDPQNNAQNLTNLLGKILRIDVDHPSGGLTYGIPADNPLAANSQGYRPEIYAWGLRNPWRFSFDSRGALWAADVGQDKYEEIDLIENGGNYGWSAREGLHDYKNVAGIDHKSLIPPVWEYDHRQGESVTGGYVYEGSLFPALYGAYVYGDFVSGRIWALWLDDSGTVHDALLLESGLNIASFGLDANHEILIVDLSGSIYRLASSD